MSVNNLGSIIDLSKNLKKIAVVDDDTHITYQQLNDFSNSAACSLTKQGVEPGNRVALVMNNGIDFIVAQLAVLKLGAIAVLINSRAPDIQKKYMIESSEATHVIDNLDQLDLYSVDDFQAHNSDLEDPALILYTAGSTSMPKGVITAHKYKQRMLINLIESDSYGSNMKILTASPLVHAAGIFQIFYSLANHATLIIQKKFNANKFIQCIEKYKVSNIMATPTLMSLLLKEKEVLSKTNLNTVTQISLASAPLNKKLYQAVKEQFKNSRVFNIYGSSEVGPGLFSHPPGLQVPELSVGCEHPYIDYRLNQGILEIKNPYMMLGYNNNDHQNITSDGYFITNDIFEVDSQGFYYFIGRADDMFTCGGYNIYPAQIETVLEKHPAVEQAAVIGIEDDIKGHKPYAFVVVTNLQTAEDHLKEFAMKHLPASYCPRKIWIVDSMPINIMSNKVNKSILTEQAKQNLK